MKAIVNTIYQPTEVLQLKKIENPSPKENEVPEAFAELERGVHLALETYSNVHRGSGHNSIVSTHLFEQARDIVLEYLGLQKGKFVVIFCTPRSADLLKAQLKPENYQSVSSQEFGLSLGVRVLAVDRKALRRVSPSQTGGGTASLVSPGWVIWAKAPDKFEAGTPAIVNVITFAKALRLIRHFGNDTFLDAKGEKLTTAKILYRDELNKYSGRKLLDELRQTLIGRSIRVPTVEGASPCINLDNAASTRTFTSIWKAVCQTWRQPGQVQQEIINEVKSICGGFLDAPLADYDVIFTSNTTEAINLMAESLSNVSGQDIEPVVLNTLLEHNSNELPWRMVPGLSLIKITIDAEGFIDLKELEAILSAYNKEGQHGKKRIRLVSVSGASNVMGTFNDLVEISRITHKYGAKLLVDAAQLVAHRKVNMEKFEIDYLAFSAHKVYAPFGTGVLVARKGLLNFGVSELELIQLSGEENAVGIAALGKALVLLQRIGMDLIYEEEQWLTGKMLSGMVQIPGLKVFGIKDQNSPKFDQRGGVVVFILKSIMPNQVARKLAEQGGIGVRYGCHCAHILIKRLHNIPPFLERVQHFIVTLFPKVELPGMVRVSLGIENSEEDIDTLIHVLDKIARKPRLTKTNVKQQMNDFAKAAARRVYSSI